MKRVFLIAVLLSFVARCNGERWDYLGAHSNYGHGCSACHVTHSPAFRKADGAEPSYSMLWGEDVTSVYKAEGINDPPLRSPELRGVLICLSCHSGNYAPQAMMKDTQYEKLPGAFAGVTHPPTFVDKPGFNPEVQFAGHPVGVEAQINCGGDSEWDCADNFTMTGVRSSRFASNYGFFLRPRRYGHHSIVVCTTCHNPHSMNITEVPPDLASSLYPTGFYPTKHYLRAPYGNEWVSRTSNVSAQFCRQCHADLSNEMNGSLAVTTL